MTQDVAGTGPTAAHVDVDAGPMALSPRIKWLWRVTYVIIALALLVAGGVVATVATDLPVAVRWAIVTASLAVGVALVVLVPAAQYRRWRYEVTADGIELRHGLLVRAESSIPHFRVQHIDVRQGPIERRLGFVTLTIATASPHTDAALPGIEPQRAAAIRALVLDRAEADDGV